MNDKGLTLPPFAALRAFHAAATHERHRDAAASLGLTESAISHQIKRLETFLQVALFDKSRGRGRLTETGQRYLEEIEPALLRIQAASEAIRPRGGRDVCRLTLPPSLAATWLIPRLGGFERARPEIELQLITSTRVLDLRREQVDLAIRYGRGDWSGLEARFLLEETAMPVCAPGYLAHPGGPPEGDLLARVRFIVSGNFPDEWEEWARAHGIDPPALADSVVLDVQEQALQVAASGHGLAMGRRPTVDDWLAQGRLVAPFGDADPTGAAYYLCKPAGSPPTAAVRRVEHWLLDAGAAWRGDET